MNLKQYYERKNQDIDALKAEVQYISATTLFRKKDFRGLSSGECAQKAIELGWRWDLSKGKYYRMIGY